jgi:hypothetical protein
VVNSNKPPIINHQPGEKQMTRKYGLLAGIAGAAFAAWWWRRRDYVARGMSDSGRGETIFSNAPFAP